MTLPTPDQRQRAEWAMQREIGRRATKSIFDERGQLDTDMARSMAASGTGDVKLGEYLHIAGIEFAKDPDGSDHGIFLSRLVEYMAALPPEWGGVINGPLSPHDNKVLVACSFLYCTGRKTPSSAPTHEKDAALYAAQSASNAESFFRNGGGSGTYWNKSEVREEVCRLIFHHTDVSAVREDRRLQVFSDAIAYESVRYSPNTAEGLALMKERIDVNKLYLGWSKNKSNARAWMQHRGWR